MSDTLIGALINQLDSGHPLPTLAAVRAFKALAEALPGIRHPEVIAGLNRVCRDDDVVICAEAREARHLMWIPAVDERVRVNGHPGFVRAVIAGGAKLTVEYDMGDAIMVDDFYVWEVEPRTKTR